MRFSQLQLIKYGQFDGCQLEFPAGAPDLQIVFGPNEAGKSTTMAAVSDLLFGFPHSTSFDFRFEKVLLRVGAHLQSGDLALTCVRKKGNVRTLLDANDQPIEEQGLLSFLGGQTRDSFHRMFSLDHGRLRQGGQAILEAQDEVGQAIFAAGSGLVSVVRLAKTLDEEASAIWAERASASRSFYVAQRAHEEARTRLRDTQLKSGHWAELKKALETIETRLAALRSSRGELQTGLQALERRRRVLTPIAQRAHLQGQLALLGDLPDLPHDAGAVLATNISRLATASTEADLAQKQKAEAEQQSAALTFNPAVLMQREAMIALRSEKGAIDKAIFDTPGLQTRAIAAGESLTVLLKEIGWPAEAAIKVQSRLPGRPQVADLRDLLERKSGLDAAAETAQAEIEAHRKELEATALEAGAGEEGGDLQPLLAALQVARVQGDIDVAVRNADLKAQRSAAAVEAALAELQPWRGSATELAQLDVPGAPEAAALASAMAKTESQAIEARRLLQHSEEERERQTLARTQLVRDEHAVSAEQVAAARGIRDQTLGQIRDHVAGSPVLAEPNDLTDRLTLEISESDKVVDRRFDAAETSASLSAIDREIERLSLLITQQSKQAANAEAAALAASMAWAAAVSIVDDDLSPTRFEAWRSRRTRVLELAETARADAAELELAVNAELKTRESLARTLPAATVSQLGEKPPIAVLVNAAQQLEKHENERREHRAAHLARVKAAEAALARAQGLLTQANQRLAAWQARWSPAVTAAGLDPDAAIAITRARLDLVEQARGLVDTIVSLEGRIRDIAADETAFVGRVRALTGECGLPDLESNTGQMLSAMESALEDAARLAERAGGLNDRIRDAEGRLQTAREAEAAAEAALEPLIRAAGASHRDELAAILARVENARAIRSQIATQDEAIIREGGGLSLDALIADAANADADILAAQSETIQGQLNELNADIERGEGERTEARLTFDKADDQPDAVDAAADMAQARSEMEVQAEAYIRKRAEAALLNWAVDRYQHEKQAPLLKRASEIFSALTLGRYSALIVDIEADKPRLAGVSADAASVVPVTGMSEGTVDQLYLSLRVAAVEETIAGGLALPFLADDLFINYDDERSAAGFRVLAELAQKTQVLFFTHHEHLIDVARTALKPAGPSVCRIGDVATSA